MPSGTPANKRIFSIFKTLGLLASKDGATHDEIRRSLECSRQSVYDVIHSIDDFFGEKIPGTNKKKPVVVKPNHERGGKFRLDPKVIANLQGPKMRELNWEEALILAFILNTRPSFMPEGTPEAMEKLRLDLGLTLPHGETSEDFFQATRKIFYISRWGKRLAETYNGFHFEPVHQEVLYSAIQSKTSVALTLHDKSELVIAPITFFEKNHLVWLLAWDTVRQLPAYIDLGQIADATDLEQPAAWPDSFTPQEWIRSQFGVSNAPRDLVVLRFSSRTAHEVRHRFWTSQDVWQDFPSGEVELSMQTPANDPALVSWIMGFGDGVSVVGPQSLRKTIAENHRSAWMAYSTERESK